MIALVSVGIAGDKVIDVKPGAPIVKTEPVEKIIACWGAIPDDILPKPGYKRADGLLPPLPLVPTIPKFAILKFGGILRQE